MKAILMSIKPKWCELIASGKKTIEVRKTAPSLKTPFKCYIYQSAQSRVCNNCNFCKSVLGITPFRVCKAKTPNIELDERQKKCIHKDLTKGKVIGEFVCDEIVDFLVFENKAVQNWNYFDLAMSCLTYDETGNYIGANKKGYGWHISDLKIYDKPKELGEFYMYSKLTDYDFCAGCPYHETPITEFPCNECKHDAWERKYLTRPPQSWCYIEELEGV